MMCIVARSLQAFIATPRKKPRPLFTATKFYYQCRIHSQICYPKYFLSPVRSVLELCALTQGEMMLCCDRL